MDCHSNFHALPTGIAERSSFPPGSSCLYAGRPKGDQDTIERGIVQEVGLNLAASTASQEDRGFLYKMVGGNDVSFCQEEELLYAPRTLVWIAAGNGQQYEGIVLGSSVEDPSSADKTRVKYNVQVTRGAVTTVYANVSPQDISYRATSANSKTSSTGTANASREEEKKVEVSDPVKAIYPKLEPKVHMAPKLELLEKTEPKLETEHESAEPTTPQESGQSDVCPATDSANKESSHCDQHDQGVPNSDAKEPLVQRYHHERSPWQEHSHHPRGEHGAMEPHTLVYNRQPNPFHTIHRCAENRIADAKTCLWNFYNGPFPLFGFCVYFHLKGRCMQGRHCHRASSHRALTMEEARQLEHVLAPAVHPQGPIYSREHHHPLMLSPNDFGRSRNYSREHHQTMLEAKENLNDAGSRSRNEKTRRSSYEERNVNDKDTASSLAKKRRSHNNEIDYRYSDGAEEGRNKQQRLSDTNKHSMTDTHKAIKWTPPSKTTVDQPWDHSCCEPPQQQQVDETILMTLPAYAFGVDFFVQNIIGAGGATAKRLGNRFECTVDLHGEALEHRSKHSMMQKSSVLYVKVTGKKPDRLLDCRRLMEKLLVRAVAPELRSFLLFRLASLNRRDTGNQAILHTRGQQKVYRIDNLASLLEGAVDSEQKHLTVVNAGPVADPQGRFIPLQPVKRNLEFLRNSHRSCVVEVFEKSEACPNIVYPFLTIYGSTHEAVVACRAAMRQVALS
ncbi:expressed unknown protein [Seminavis robusta]|uniref:K Homology domain-containing protein n=1 Tax=Seminavis robusta TaxID=568900 RepID=A0A9N8I040_9STRA|nr:expressed unknown protein [Seminavis robusta]|eukprot:Sro2503_g329570.1 n/a (731) ;mRNA; r:1937-4129